MIAIVCALLTAAGGYFSFGLGHLWWLAWLAPVPVLWLALGQTRPWQAFLAAWAGFALGLSSLERAYGGVLPAPVLALDVLTPALLFAVAAMGARRVAQAFGPVAAMFTFAALWTGLDLLVSLDPAVGTMVSPASTQVGAPVLIQGAALVGFCGVTFLLGTAAAGAALSLRTRNPAPLLIAVGLLAANTVYGYWRISHAPVHTLRVALIDSNALGYWAPSLHEHQSAAANQAAALRVIDAYTAQIGLLRGRGVQLVVLPENIAQIAAAWRGQAWAKLAAAASATGATVVGGFNMVLGGARRNVSLAFMPGAARPIVYEKRDLVPVAESDVFAPGAGPAVLPNGVGLEICLDMDSPRMIRRDEAATRPRLLAVPASEIGTHGDWSNLGVAADGWFHARDAMLRSVEDGVPMARSAGRGLLTLSDRYGRVIAQAPTSAGFTTLVGELPLGGRGGGTLYDRIGDLFGWLCLALAVAAVGVSSWRRKVNPQTPTTATPKSGVLPLLCILAACSGWQPPAAAAAGINAAYPVGVTQRRFRPPGPYDWRHARMHVLLTTVWYPAAATARETQQWIGSPRDPFARAGEAAPHAAPAPMPERFPLIVISHGTGGSALAMAWLGRRLAARGFIAAAVDHPGNNALEPYTTQGFTLWWLRAKDLSEVIDGMLTDRRFGPRIDARRIGAAGFSLGGYTMIEIAGGRTSPAIFHFCAGHPRARRCAAPPEFPTLTASASALFNASARYRAAIRGAGAGYRDPRVRAVFALAPAGGPFFAPASLKSISIPVEIVAGSADAIEPVAANAGHFAAQIPGSRLVLFPGAGHYTFFATCTALGRKAQPGLCADGPGIDRHRLHAQAAALAVKFFSVHLR
jgi:predicted dienelactone hydrolase/apolipoprotein N-acyltransferase